MIEPLRVQQQDPQHFTIRWKGGKTLRYSAYALRINCPCAVCVDEWTGKQVLDDTTVPQDLAITAMDMVGRYALAFKFSDGHYTGIYSFDMLFGMGEAMAAPGA